MYTLPYLTEGAEVQVRHARLLSSCFKFSQTHNYDTFLKTSFYCNLYILSLLKSNLIHKTSSKYWQKQLLLLIRWSKDSQPYTNRKILIHFRLMYPANVPSNLKIFKISNTSVCIVIIDIMPLHIYFR